MRTRTVVSAVIATVLTTFMASASQAECPDGKAEVTIVQGNSGKVMTLCVPEAAIPHIGGNGEVVIPAVCPCWDSGFLEAFVRDYPVVGTCYDGTDPGGYDTILVSETEQGDLEVDILVSHHPDSCETYPHWCQCMVLDHTTQPETLVQHLGITADEAEACRAVLLNSSLWELYCDGS